LRAEKNGHEDVVKLLREPRKAASNPGLKNLSKQRLLPWVAKKGKEVVVKLRLERGKANVGLMDRDKQTSRF
jgi:ankyrin repeat protein